MSDVVTRFAPSPTGDLHIGGARTAIFNWAFARHHGGRFVLRFEDTDRERSEERFERVLLDALAWLQIDHDPVSATDPVPRQSERAERYAEIVATLLERGAAYRCTCTPEAVEAMRERARAAGRNPIYDGTCRDKGHGADLAAPFCVRLRVPDTGGNTRWEDLCAGPSGQDAEELDDFVIARTDGSAIYHFAVVVDDHDMAISHVLRGREHMTSTPRQLLIYQALGWEPPRFGHVPLLVGESGKKLSKREADVSVGQYRARGFLSEAVFNYLCRMGWGHGDLEIFSSEDLVRLFDVDGVGRSPAQVRDDKLLWLSQHYIKTLPRERLLAELPPFLAEQAGAAVEIDAGLAALVDLLRERSRSLVEMAEKARFYYVDALEYDPKAARKFLTAEAAGPLADLRAALAETEPWDEASLEAVFQAVVEARELKLGALAQPVRVALTGSSASPGIFETLAACGRELVLRRLDRALAAIASAPGD